MESQKKRRILANRRDFLKLSGGAGVSSFLWSPEILGEVAHPDDKYTFVVNRGLDLAQVKIKLLNYSGAGPRFVPLVGREPFVVLEFPSQNIAEAIFDESHKDSENFETDPLLAPENSRVENDPNSPLNHFLSGPSWLVFRMDRREQISLGNLDDFLALLSERPLKVPLGADDLTGSGFRPSPPHSDETRLEIPYRLYISPESDTRVRFSKVSDLHSAPNQRKSIHGLWHAELFSRRKLVPAESSLKGGVPEELKAPEEVSARARAIWSPDYRASGEPKFSLYYPAEKPLSLHALTRHLLVKQNAEGDGWIDIVHLILTAIGSSADLHYASQRSVDEIIERQLKPDKGAAADTNLRLWKHRIVLGRDVFFVEAFLGFLFPFCHPSVYVEVTQRKPASRGEKIKKLGDVPVGDPKFEEVGPLGYYLLKKRFIIVQEPIKRFCNNGSPFGRSLPTKEAQILTIQSPNLEDPAEQDFTEKGKSGIFFWPRIKESGDEVNWDIEVTDSSGRKMRSSSAKLFFASNIGIGHDIYRNFSEPDRTIRFPGSKFAFTEEVVDSEIEARVGRPSENKGASLEVNSMIFGSERVDNEFKRLQFLLDSKDGFKTKLVELFNGGGDDTTRVKVWLKAQLTLRGIHTAEAIMDDVVVEIYEYVQTLNDEVLHAIEQGSQFLHTVLDKAEVLIPAVKGIAPGVPASTIEYLDEYISGGFKDISENGVKKVANEAFAKLTQAIGKNGSIGNSIQTGVIQPSVIISGLSREVGAIVADGDKAVEEFARKIEEGATFDVIDAIPDMKILGTIPLKNILSPLLKKGELPSIESLELPDRIERSWLWTGRVQTKSIKSFLTFKQFGPESRREKEDLVSLYLKSTAIVDLKEIKESGKLDSAPSSSIDLDGYLGWVCENKGAMKANRWEKSPRDGQPAFAVNLLDLIEVRFRQLSLGVKHSTGESVETLVKPEIDQVAFLGPLAFVSKIQQFLARLGVGGSERGTLTREGFETIENIELPTALSLYDGSSLSRGEVIVPEEYKEYKFEPHRESGGLADRGTRGGQSGGFSVDYDSKGVRAVFGLSIPPISFGVFSMWNLRLMSELELPFIGDPMRFEFALSSYAKPFEISVMGFAGRGFFGVAIDADGYRKLEGSLEFGGSLGFEVPAVASGGLYLMAGAYFKITSDTTELAGTIRAGGHLRVIGLINASVEFLLSVTHRKIGDQSELYGTCTVVVNIDLWIFEGEVAIGMEKRIRGSKNSQQDTLAAAKTTSQIIDGLSNTEGIYKEEQFADTQFGTWFDFTPLNNPIDGKNGNTPFYGRYKDAGTFIEHYGSYFAD